MNFKDFMRFHEDGMAEWGYFGKIISYIGGDKSECLNYGSGTGHAADPMLYVPIKRGETEMANIISSARRKIAKRGIECKPNPISWGGWDCKQAEMPHNADIMHTGESHVTVAQDKELEAFFKDAKNINEKLNLLKQVKTEKGTSLFDENGIGIKMPIVASTPAEIIYGVSKFFKNRPLVALLKIECPLMQEVRSALGLGPLPPNYKSHVTIGYAYGVVLDDLITTDLTKGTVSDSASKKHNKGFLSRMGIDQYATEKLGPNL
jgi:hypothetical protein